MINKRTLLLVALSGVILGVLVYVPIIPYSLPLPSLPVSGWCFGCFAPTPHVDSITLQLFSFGGQYYWKFGGPYAFCTASTCGSIWFLGVLYGILVALMAIDVGLIARFLSNRSGMRGASAQMGIGVLALLSPLLPLNSVLILEEVLVAGVVLILTGLAELWLFRATENYDFTLKAEEQVSIEQAVNKT